MEDRGRKMSGKRKGMMENDATRTAEETQDDDDLGGGRYMVLWGRNARKAVEDGGEKVWWRICGTTGTVEINIWEVRERIDRKREGGG